MSSAVELSLRLLRDQGYTVESVEKWIQAIQIRKDLYGFIDLMAMGNGHILAVQVCGDTKGSSSTSDYAKHVNKLKEPRIQEALTKWLVNGGAFSMHTWSVTKCGSMKAYNLKESQPFIWPVSKGNSFKWKESDTLNVFRKVRA